MAGRTDSVGALLLDSPVGLNRIAAVGGLRMCVPLIFPGIT